MYSEDAVTKHVFQKWLSRFYREIFRFKMHLALAEISSGKMIELADANPSVLKNIGFNLDTSARLAVWVPP